MLRKLRDWLWPRGKALEEARVRVEDQGSFSDSVDRTMEAITFAEAGMHQVAQEIVAEQQPIKRKILALGYGQSFSKAVVDYALGFAERMNYEIVALNVLPAGRDRTTTAPFCSIMNEQWLSKYDQSIATFYRRCEAKGIPFRHIVKLGEIKRCIQEVRKEIRRINFVVSEPETWPNRAEERHLTAITVFSPAS